MIGILWNCRGVAKKGRGNCIKDLLKDFKADFIGLQETMKQKFTEKFFRAIIPTRLMPGTGCPLEANLEGSYVELKWRDLKLLK
jgi:hypothetical protein